MVAVFPFSLDSLLTALVLHRYRMQTMGISLAEGLLHRKLIRVMLSAHQTASSFTQYPTCYPLALFLCRLAPCLPGLT